MAKGMVAFLRATLGFEPEIIKEGEHTDNSGQPSWTIC